MSSGLQRLKAATLTLAVLVVLAAATFPPCANASCCAHTDETAVEAPMECCREASFSPRETVDSLAATANPTRSVDVAAFETPVTAESFAPPVATALTVPPPRLHDPAPPLFLLNEQFRI